MALAGVLKPKNTIMVTKHSKLLTKTNLFVISGGLISLLGKDFFRVLENSDLLLIGSFVLKYIYKVRFLI